MSDYTKGKWVFDGHGGICIWDDKQNNCIAVAKRPYPMTNKVCEANARRIVQCVNSYDDLVAALIDIAKIPCINDLLGESLEEETFIGCSCAPCRAKQALQEVNNEENI